MEALSKAPSNLADAAPAITDERTGNLAAERRRRRSRPVGVRKHVEVRQRRTFQITLESGDVLLCFARKADDDVRADRGIRNASANVVNERGILFNRVRAAHCRKHPIAGVLQR